MGSDEKNSPGATIFDSEPEKRTEENSRHSVILLSEERMAEVALC